MKKFLSFLVCSVLSCVVQTSQPAFAAEPQYALTDAQLRKSPVIVTFGTQNVTVSSVAGVVVVAGPLTNQQLRAAPIHVLVDSLPSGSTALTNSELRATPVPVTITGGGGSLTDTQLRASPVTVNGTVTVGSATVTQATGSNLHVEVDAAPTTAVTGTFWQAIQPISGTVSVSSAPTTAVTGPLTDAQLRAATVPISGTVTASGPVTDTQLRATPVPVSGTVTVTDGAGALNVIVDSGTSTVTQATGTNLHAVIDAGSTTAVTALPVGHNIIDSGTVTAVTAITNALPAGSNVIGHVINDTGSTTAVTGTVAVSGPVTDTQIRATPLPVSGTVTVTDGAGALNVIVDSGSLTANAGTNLNTSALALSATQTDRSQFTKLTDGTRDGTVKAASTLPLLTDTAVVTTQRDPLPAGTNVIGHTIIDTGSTTAVTALPVGHNILDSGTTTVTQATGTNLHAVLDTTSTTAVTQATGTNLHTVVDSGTITAVTAITNALPAGSNVIGHVIHDTGSTTAVTGNVTAVQPTGTNLHVVVDTAPSTAVTGTFWQTTQPVSLGNTTASGTLNAKDANCTVALAGQHGAGFLLATGTLLGTIVPEISYDGGTTYTSTEFDNQTTNAKVPSLSFVDSVNGQNTGSIVMAAGATHARVRVSSFQSGTAACTIAATNVNDPSVIFTGAVGSMIQPPTVAQIGGWNGTALSPVNVSPGGALLVYDPQATQPLSNLIPRCNSVRRLSCR